MLRNVIRYLHPEHVVEVSAPQNVESVIMEDANNEALYVHLIGYQSPPQCTPSKDRPYVLPSLIEDAPMYAARIIVRRPFTRAQALDPRTQVHADGNIVHLVVNDIHEVLVIK
ncbi:MAG TPA: hypothetical protein PLI07_10195 [Candidatus Hydrogenedentes bacterium]|nr:hypothetical protein [Candidatus Hydrogenedentota bacterium]